MTAYIARRIFYAIPILIGVNLFTFVLFFVVNTPDDIARSQLGDRRVTTEAIENWINKFETNNSSKNRKIELVDQGGCLVRISYDKNYSIIVLTNAEINNPSNKSFVDFSEILLEIIDEEFSKGVL